MIDEDDLRAAVQAGMITEAQAATLGALAHRRRGARENLAEGDEPFELFRGFNEIFIVVGLIVLATGWIGLAGVSVTLMSSDPRNSVIFWSMIGAALVWLLSEYFIRRRRMVAPAIMLSVLWAGNALPGLAVAFANIFELAMKEYSSLTVPLGVTTAAVALFWWRFRVPFATAMIAVGLFVTAMLLAASSSGSPTTLREVFLLSADGPFAWITLALGALVFAVAMAFDMSDPHRVTRRAANGFWLHLVAAPALVNTLALTLLERQNHPLLAAMLVVLAAIAIIIDRRSFLIAAIGYTVVLSGTLFEADGAAVTVFLLGLGLLLLGAFWDRIRALLLAMLPGWLPLEKLPPSTAVPLKRV
ncbi:hypothetical protein [Litorisediminicola beolgyonensis]|uniref:DUF2157 domain-containing protein n=1 Tax=Litorisediminicola beolgyonensis TaxID=1173614 RepID=A0ABW3ZHM2_9RHOB